jgi:hypothetical protein
MAVSEVFCPRDMTRLAYCGMCSVLTGSKTCPGCTLEPMEGKCNLYLVSWACRYSCPRGELGSTDISPHPHRKSLKSPLVGCTMDLLLYPSAQGLSRQVSSVPRCYRHVMWSIPSPHAHRANRVTALGRQATDYLSGECQADLAQGIHLSPGSPGANRLDPACSVL